MNPIEQRAQPHIRDLEPYVPGFQPGEDGWIKINTNEFPFPPPKAVGEAIEAEVERLARYPDPRSEQLREALAKFHRLKAGQVIIGNGSDDLLNLLARAFGGSGRETVETFPSYSLYPVITAIAGGEIHSIAFSGDFRLPVEQLVETKADLLFLTCPNAPTGVRFPTEDLKALCASMEGLVVIDEAYGEFATESAIPLLAEHGNLVVTRTFSKAYGLAGLRVGYAMASKEVVEILDRIRDSYNVNRLSQAGALAALKAQSYYRKRIKTVIQTRESVRKALTKLGWEVFPSEANFLFAAPVDGEGKAGLVTAIRLFEYLKEHKILVRIFPKHPLTAPYLRISIGSKPEMELFLETVRSWTKHVQ